MAATQQLSHVAMSVPPGTLTDEWRQQVLDFYGELFGWKEMDRFRLPDRMTISVGSTYVRAVWDHASKHAADCTLEPLNDGGDGYVSFRVRYLLPLTVEAQYFPPGATQG